MSVRSANGRQREVAWLAPRNGLSGLVCASISACFTLCVICEGVGSEVKSWWKKLLHKEQMNVSYLLSI